MPVGFSPGPQECWPLQPSTKEKKYSKDLTHNTPQTSRTSSRHRELDEKCDSMNSKTLNIPCFIWSFVRVQFFCQPWFLELSWGSGKRSTCWPIAPSPTMTAYAVTPDPCKNDKYLTLICLQNTLKDVFVFTNCTIMSIAQTPHTHTVVSGILYVMNMAIWIACWEWKHTKPLA